MCRPAIPASRANGEPPLFTDFTYDNLGMPRNHGEPVLHKPRTGNPAVHHWVDQGFTGFLGAAGYPRGSMSPELGKQKVPTLRNVDLRPSEGFVKAFRHNGFFKSSRRYGWLLRRPRRRGCGRRRKWRRSEHGRTREPRADDREEAAIVVFMKTLTDGYKPK